MYVFYVFYVWLSLFLVYCIRNDKNNGRSMTYVVSGIKVVINHDLPNLI